MQISIERGFLSLRFELPSVCFLLADIFYRLISQLSNFSRNAFSLAASISIIWRIPATAPWQG